MNEPTTYDLGEIKFDPPSFRSDAVKRERPAREAVASEAAFEAPTVFDLPASLSLFVPGTGQMLRGDLALGLFFLTWLGFLVSLGWAVATTLDRSVATLKLLGYPIGMGVWVLAGLFVVAATLHVANLLIDGRAAPARCHASHPVVSGLASAVLPGWGQLLNGHRARGAVFVAGLWVVGGAWAVSRPEILTYLDGLGLFVPENLLRLAGPPLRWTAPAVIWALAVYDAVVGGSTDA